MEHVMVVKNVEELKKAIDLGKVFIWDPDDGLHRALEETAKELNPSAKMRIRGCRNVRFKADVVLRKFGSEEIVRFRELKELGDRLLDINELDLLSLTSNDRAEMFELIQQLINLGINTNVYLEEELERKRIIENFKEYRKRLLGKVQRLRQSLEKNTEELVSSLKNSPDLETVKAVMGELLKATEEMEKAIEEAEERPIKVAIFATKKAGKSMVVNGLLEEEYAPTSNELPTPCIIVYKPHDDNRIRLEYNNSEHWFNDEKSLKEYLKQLFEDVSLEGKKLPAMTIYYPKKNGVNYEIVDTPGPDLAGSEHEELVREIIEDADVAVFLIDYSKYAQKSEVELLKELKDYFHGKRPKYNSLVVAINKVDLVFKDVNLEKINLRITDFVFEKFKTLGFESFAVISISALLAFYMKKLRQFFGEEILSEKDVRSYLENKYYEVGDEIPDTYIAEVQNVANSFSKTFKKREVNFNELYSFTGFDVFERHIKNLVSDKAELDRLWDCVTVFDSGLTKADNITGQTAESLIEKREATKRALDDFSKELENVLKPKKDEFLREFSVLGEYFYKTLEDIERQAEEILDAFDKVAQDLCETIDRKHKRVLADLRSVRKGELSPEDLDEEIVWIDEEDEKAIRERIKVELGRLHELLETVTLSYWEEKLQKDLDNLVKKYQEEVKKFKEKAQRDYGVEINLKLPEIALRVSFESFKKLVKKFDKPLLEPLESTVDFESNIRGGVVRAVGHFLLGWLFDIDRYKVEPELYEELRAEKDDAKDTVRKVIEKLKEYTEGRLREITSKMKESFEPTVDENRKKCEAYLSVIDRSVQNLLNMAKMDIYTLGRVIEVFKVIREEVFNEVREAWKSKVIRGNKKKGEEKE